MKKICLILCLLAGFSLPIFPSDSEDQKKIIQELYKEFAWEAVFAPSNKDLKGFVEQPQEVLEKYLNTELSQLIIQDSREAQKTQEIQRLDFCPLWDSQDPKASDLEIDPFKDKNMVRVSFKYSGSNEIICIDYIMAKTNQGWRISDIQYQNGDSLLKTLKSK